MGPLLAWLAAINLLTLAAFALDKRRARLGLRRIPERTLLWLATLGGTPGALLARQALRHKTRKQPFTSWLLVIVAAQLAAVAVAYFGGGFGSG